MRYLYFCLDFLVVYRKALIRKIRLLYNVTTWFTKHLQYTYCPISQKAKAIRQWNLVSLYNNNTRNNFLEKSYTECDTETIPRPSLEKQNWAYFLINGQSLTQFVFVVCWIENYQNLLKLSFRPLVLTHIKGFLKTKKEAWN